MLGGGYKLFRPAALLAQRQGVRGHRVADPDPWDGFPDRGHQPGGLDAERHRGLHTGIPAAGPDDLVPVTQSARPHVEQDLAGSWRARVRQLEEPDGAPGPVNARG